MEAVVDHEQQTRSNDKHVKFKLAVGEQQYDEVMDYAQIIDHINRKENDTDATWQFEKIIGHQGPLSKNDPHYNGSRFNVQILWSTGETTYEPLTVIGADSPVICAVYARDNGLLDEPGWKRFKGLAQREQKMLRTVPQAKLLSLIHI